jgi:hypothetical protein
MLKHLLVLASLTLLLLNACSPELTRQRQWRRYIKDLKQAPPIPPDTLSGAYEANDELEILDELLRKYPGKQKTRVVTKTETIKVPGKTVYVEVPVRLDTARDITERDSLLRKLEVLVQTERASSELRAEVARLRVGMLRAFATRACLPDTVVRFEEYDLTLTIKRGQNNHYGFTWRKGEETIKYEAQITEHKNGRVVVVPAPVWWRDKWFWLMMVFASLTVWLTYLRLRDAGPAR